MYSSDAKNVDLRTGLDGHRHGFLSASGMVDQSGTDHPS